MVSEIEVISKFLDKWKVKKVKRISYQLIIETF